MSLRDTLQSSPVTGIVVVGAILLLAVIILARSGPETATYTSWYYDLESQQQVKGGAKPPSATALPARVFGCGGCDGELFVGYLEMSNPDPPPPSPDRPMDPSVHTLIAAVPEPGAQPQWHVGGTAEARAIVEAPAARCEQRYRECLP